MSHNQNTLYIRRVFTCLALIETRIYKQKRAELTFVQVLVTVIQRPHSLFTTQSLKTLVHLHVLLTELVISYHKRFPGRTEFPNGPDTENDHKDKF